MKKTRKNISIRGLTLNSPLFLAPMAGLTHLALRRTIVELGGIGLLSTEMLNARSLPQENQLISPYLLKTEEERPLAYQIFTSTPEDIAPAMEALHRFGADVIDLNMGCPAPRLRKIGAGAALMDKPELSQKLVAEARRRTKLPLTAKIRLGSELDAKKLQNFCLILEGGGIDLLTVHARLQGESFQRKPRWDWVAKVKSWLSIPVVANGGIFSVADAKNCLEISGADGLMIGRGAATRPWLFSEISRELFGAKIEKQKIYLPGIYHRFAELLESHFPSERRLGRLKEFTHYFGKNYLFGHTLASKVQSSKSFEDALTEADIFFSTTNQGFLSVFRWLG